MMSFALSGEHDFGKLDLDWQASYSKAYEHRPQERYITFVAEDQAFSPDISDTGYPTVTLDNASIAAGISSTGWKFDELTEERQYTEDVDRNFALNLKYDLSADVKFQFGGKVRDKNKKRDNNFYSIPRLIKMPSWQMLMQTFQTRQRTTSFLVISTSLVSLFLTSFSVISI